MLTLLAAEPLPVRFNCLGKFSIPLRVIHETPQLAQEMLRDMIVVRAEINFAECVKYQALHPSFEAVPAGEEPPLYGAVFDVPDGGGDRRFLGWLKHGAAKA